MNPQQPQGPGQIPLLPGAAPAAEETLEFQQIAQIARRHWKLAVAIIALGTMAGYGLAQFLPKRYKSQALFNLQSSYFQVPLVSGVVTEVSDSSQAQAQKEALVKLALGDDFLERLGAKYQLFKQPAGTPEHALEREGLGKRIEYFLTNSNTFQITVTAREAGMAQSLATDAIEQVMTTLASERRKNFMQVRDSLRRQIEFLGYSMGGSAKAAVASSSSQPDVLRNELRSLEDRIAAMERQYTPSHPEVAALKSRADGIRSTLRKMGVDPSADAQGGGSGSDGGGSARRRDVVLAPTQKQAKAELYDDLTKKINYLDIVLELEQNRDNVQYMSVIQRPTLPARPIFPNPINFTGGGFMLSLLLAAIAIAARELKRATTLTPQTAARTVGAPFLGVLPHLPDAAGVIEARVARSSAAAAPMKTARADEEAEAADGDEAEAGA